MRNKLLSGLRVLVVEDEMLVLMSMEDILADLGCESVSAAASVDQALALVDSEIFDAALLDVNLNGSKSYPVADALAARGVPFAFSTGYSDHGSNTSYREWPVLKKPYQRVDVIKMFTRLLSRAVPLLGHGKESL